MISFGFLTLIMSTATTEWYCLLQRGQVVFSDVSVHRELLNVYWATTPVKVASLANGIIKFVFLSILYFIVSSTLNNEQLTSQMHRRNIEQQYNRILSIKIKMKTEPRFKTRIGEGMHILGPPTNWKETINFSKYTILICRSFAFPNRWEKNSHNEAHKISGECKFKIWTFTYHHRSGWTATGSPNTTSVMLATAWAVKNCPKFVKIRILVMIHNLQQKDWQRSVLQLTVDKVLTAFLAAKHEFHFSSILELHDDWVQHGEGACDSRRLWFVDVCVHACS